MLKIIKYLSKTICFQGIKIPKKTYYQSKKNLYLKESDIKKSASYRIDEKLLKEFDEATKKNGVKKTFVIEEAIKNFIKKINSTK